MINTVNPTDFCYITNAVVGPTDYSTYNYNGIMRVGRAYNGDHRTFIHYPLNGLKIGTISSATISFISEWPNTVKASMHRVTNSWTSSGATWIKRDGVTSWSPAGGEYYATSLGDIDIPGDSAFTFIFNSDGVAALNSIVSGTYANDGLMLANRVDSTYGNLLYLTGGVMTLNYYTNSSVFDVSN
jgi:hypothetical protein